MNPPIQVQIENCIYPKQAVLDAKHAFAPYVDIKVVPNSGGVTLFLVVKPLYKAEIRQIYCEFMNYLLDRTIQIVSEKDAL